MTRQMDLSTVRNRDRLAPQNEPYWQRLGTGRHLGFRVSKLGGGTWVARHYDSARKKNSFHGLGDFAELPPNKRFDQAKREAESWFASSPEAIPRRHATTVREACEEYAAINPEAEGRFRRGIYSHPIANIPLEKLSRRQLAEWVEQLSNRPALVSRSKKGPIRQRPRSPASINRDITAFRAALNRAFQLELVSSDRAWRIALKPVPDATGRRNTYLDIEQRRALVNAAADEIRPFCEALCYLPVRPGAMATLKVKDFDSRRNELTVDNDKKHGQRRILLPQSTAALFANASRGKKASQRACPIFCV